MIENILNQIGLPWAYGRFLSVQEPPFLVYMGTGQNTFQADNTHYYRQNTHRIEYYFTIKDESVEAEIEDAILGAGLLYEKSEDTYIDSEDVFVVYYYLN